MSYRSLIAIVGTLLFLFTHSPIQADVQMPAIFGDHMVLQEGAKLPVWGTAAPGEAVTVTVGKETGKATADAAGKWRVDLAPLATSAEPVTMTVTGKNSLTFQDVLVGEVWLCSGQSNMEFDLGGGKYGFGGASNALTAVPAANDPQLRLFIVAHDTSLDPVSDVKGTWQVCVPETAGKFSAVGYFFGRDLRKTLNRPVGLIGSYWGGTVAQAWTSLSGLKKDPKLQHFVATYEKVKADFPQATAGNPAKQAAYKVEMGEWQKKPEVQAYMAAFQKWREASDTASAAGQEAPPRPPLPATPAPQGPPRSDGGANSPTNLYNGMIAPLIPFAIKGAIWYQGESNANKADEYGTLFPRMITDWREKWDEGDFPFLFVQLASFRSGSVQNWPYLREAQLKALSLPNTGMATAIDIGVPNNIHPQDKEDVGHRLALAARHIAYGEKLTCSGPLYDSMAVSGDKIDLTFTQQGEGLIIGKAPWVPAGFKPLPTDKLLGFTIAGDDKKFVPANAHIEKDKVIVSSPEVPKPVAVRYDWANAPEGNLYNKEGLPASSFRTDEWPDPVDMGDVATATKSGNPGTK